MLEKEKIPKSQGTKISKIFVDENLRDGSTKISNDENREILNSVLTADESSIEESKTDDNNTTNSTVKLDAVGVEIAKECMICNNPFAMDWQHKEYNICPTCRKKLNKLINGVD